MKNKALRIGIFVIITLVTTYLLINFLKGNDFLKGSNTYYTRFDQVEGLNPASPVFIRGFKVGTLKGITYEKTSGSFLVSFSIKEDFDIPEDSRAELFSSDLLGGRAIRILEGQSTTLAANGTHLPGIIIPDALGSLMSSLPSFTDNIGLLVQDLRGTIKQVNQLMNQDNQDLLHSILYDLSRTTDQLQRITGAVEEEEIRHLVANASRLTSRLDSTVMNADQTLRNIEGITAQLNEADLDKLIISLRGLSERLQDPNGSLGKFLQTDSLHQSILDLTKDIDSLVKKIEENPKKYLKISVF